MSCRADVGLGAPLGEPRGDRQDGLLVIERLDLDSVHRQDDSRFGGDM